MPIKFLDDTTPQIPIEYRQRDTLSSMIEKIITIVSAAFEAMIATFFSAIGKVSLTFKGVSNNEGLRQALHAWCKEKEGTPEEKVREDAASILLECDRNKRETLSLVSLGGNTSLTTLPAVMSQLTHLRRLELSGHAIADISPLSTLTKLRVLRLNDNQIKDLSPLCNLKLLQDLNLARNQISEIAPLNALRELEILDLARNKIVDTSSLTALTKLQMLHLDHNQMSDTSSLSSMTELRYLTLAGNKISAIEPLEKLKKLRVLHLNGNAISDASPLNTSVELRDLNLGDNQIEVIPVALANLHEEAKLNVANNPLSPDAKFVFPGQVSYARKFILFRGPDVFFQNIK